MVRTIGPNLGSMDLPANPERRSRVGRGGDAATMARDRLTSEGHELRVASGEAILVDPDVVLEPGANRIGPPRQRPAHHLGLVAPDPRRGPRRFRHQPLE